MYNRHIFGYTALLISLVVIALSALVWANIKYFPQSIGRSDFAIGWSGSNSWLINGISPYDPSVLTQARAIQSQINNSNQATELSPGFIYPLYAIIFFGPFSMVGYQLASMLWVIAIEVCYVLFVILSIRLMGWHIPAWQTGIIVILMMVWFNGSISILEGQFDIISIFMMVLSIFLIVNHQDVSGGFLLALATINPDVSFLLVLYVIVWSLFSRRYKLLISIFASFLFLLFTSLLLFPEWPLQWVRLMIPAQNNAGLYQNTLSMFSQSLPGIQLPLNIFLHALVIITMLIGWIRSARYDKHLFIWTAMMTFAVTSLIGYRVDLSYSILLLPGLFFILRVWQERWATGGKIAVWLVLVLVFLVSWIFYLSGIQKTGTIPIAMYLLPPITILIGLFWIRWWAIRASKMPLELMRDRIGL